MKTHSLEMKRNGVLPPPPQASHKRRPGMCRHLKGLGRPFMMGIFLALFSLAGIANSSAAKIDGRYRFISGSGVIKAGGERIQITEKMAKGFVEQTSGYAVVKDRRLKLHINGAKKTLSALTTNTGITAKVKGPNWIRMKKGTNAFLASTKTPVILTLGGSYQGQSVSGTIRYKFKPRLKNGRLTIKVPISGNLLGYKVTGYMNMVCKKK